MTLYVVVYVCLVGHPCDEKTARAYQAFRAPPGVIICGAPILIAPLIEAGLGPDPEQEYLRIRCRLQ